MIWDWEFKQGNWSYLEEATDPELFEYLVQVLKGGALLDLGCGNGVVRCALPVGAFSRYVGVDLSAEALQRLQDRAAASPAPTDGQLLIAGDFTADHILAKVGGPFDVILLHDSIYYLDRDRVPDFLRRLTALLTPQGLIVVRIHDRFRYERFIDDIHEVLTTVEETTDDRRILIAARGQGAR